MSMVTDDHKRLVRSPPVWNRSPASSCPNALVPFPVRVSVPTPATSLFRLPSTQLLTALPSPSISSAVLSACTQMRTRSLPRGTVG
jgi:hypothetical protein